MLGRRRSQLRDETQPRSPAAERVEERPAKLGPVHEVEDKVGGRVDADEEVGDLDDVLDGRGRLADGPAVRGAHEQLVEVRHDLGGRVKQALIFVNAWLSYGSMSVEMVGLGYVRTKTRTRRA